MNNEEISQKEIRDLLTGRLDESTTDRLDELSVTSPEFAERVAAERYEMIDDWVAGRTDGDEKAAIEALLARSPTLREKVEISRTLTAAAPRAVVVERSAEPSFFSRLFGGGMPRLAYGFAGLAVLIGIAGLAAFLLRRDGTVEISQTDPPVVSSPSVSPVEQTQTPASSPSMETVNTPTPTPASTESPRPSPTPTRRSPVEFVAIMLAPPTRGSTSMRSVKIDENTKFLNLTLQTEAPSSSRYSVEIGDASGAADWRSPVVRGKSANGRTSVSVRVPASRLKKGIRSVRLLDANTESEIVDEHLLRIER